MKTAYDFQTELDLGTMGVRTVEVSFSYDSASHTLNLMSVHLLERGNIGAEITDYLNDAGEDQIYEEMSKHAAKAKREEQEYQLDMARDRAREAAWELEA